jgi:polyisoprenoid-binding protein YceI
MTWNIDNTHSEVGFSVRHMMLSTVRGKFTQFEGEVELDPAQLERASVKARIAVASISTSEDKRDAHLRSPDFFDAEKFPSIEFRSTKVTRKGDKVELEGLLKIRDQEHPVQLSGEVVGPGKDPWGNVRLGFSLSGEIEREKWGLTWNQALETGGVLVGKKIKLEIETQLVQK